MWIQLHDVPMNLVIKLIHDACTTRDLEFNDEIIPAKKVHYSFMSALAGFAKVINCHEFIQKKID